MVNDDLKETEKDECPYCGSKKIEDTGAGAGTRAKKSSEYIPGVEIYKCLDCNKSYYRKFK